MFFKSGWIYFFFLTISFQLASQTVREKIPSYFGIQYKPLIPEDFLGKPIIDLKAAPLSSRYTQTQGYSFGAVVRVGFTKLISFETGINQVKRNYKVSFSLPDSNLTDEFTMGIISYDIPVNFLFYIQLSKKFFMNASLGSSLAFFPSNVGRYSVIDKHVFIAEGRRTGHFGATINANLGFEFRSKKTGFFYLGASGVIPARPIYQVAASYEYGNSTIYSAIGALNGAYLSLDFRYFFPSINKKGEQVKQGPIQQ